MIRMVGNEAIEMTPEEIAAFEKERESLGDAVFSSYSLFKTTLWLRLTDEEAEIVMAAKNAQPAKFRGIWDDALSIQSDSEFFGALHSFLAKTLSVGRADDLLQPEA